MLQTCVSYSGSRLHGHACWPSIADTCRDRASSCCAAEAPLRMDSADGCAAEELQTPVPTAAPAADVDRVRAIQERVKQQRAEQPPASYSLHATQATNIKHDTEYPTCYLSMRCWTLEGVTKRRCSPCYVQAHRVASATLRHKSAAGDSPSDAACMHGRGLSML